MSRPARTAALAAMIAVPLMAVTSSPADAATKCDGYKITASSTLSQGASRTEPNGNYFWSFVAGTYAACLDGPDGTQFDLVLQQFVGTGWATVANATPRSGADKTLAYNGPAGTFRLLVTAVSGSGAYTVGLTRP